MAREIEDGDRRRVAMYARWQARDSVASRWWPALGVPLGLLLAAAELAGPTVTVPIAAVLAVGCALWAARARDEHGFEPRWSEIPRSIRRPYEILLGTAAAIVVVGALVAGYAIDDGGFLVLGAIVALVVTAGGLVADRRATTAAHRLADEVGIEL